MKKKKGIKSLSGSDESTTRYINEMVAHETSHAALDIIEEKIMIKINDPIFPQIIDLREKNTENQDS